MSQEDQQGWLTELARITRPGGFFFLTTEGRFALDKLAPKFGSNVSQMQEKLNEQGFLYRSYEVWNKQVKVGDTVRPVSEVQGVSYGNAVMSPDYIQKNWPAAGFEVVGLLEGIIDHRQDLVVRRKRS